MAEDKKIEVNESELRAILEQNKKLAQDIVSLQKAVGDKDQTGSLVMRKVVNRTVRLMFINGKPVLGYANRGSENKPQFVYERPDPSDKNNRLLYPDLIVQGIDKPITTNYNEFLKEAERRICNIIRIEEKKLVTEDGVTKVKEVEGFSMIETGVVVPMEVMSTKRTFVVDIGDNQEVSIDEKYVNIV